MKRTPTADKVVAQFPGPLRRLIESELAAGNSIAEIGGSFPAPPAGAYVRLAQAVTTRPRKTQRGVVFFDRNNSSYSGEFTDSRRFYFVLEPPRPPEPPPDMDKIRVDLETKQRKADEKLYESQKRSLARRTHGKVRKNDSEPPSPEVILSIPATPPKKQPETTFERFQESMICTYERWREGIGYDLDCIKKATPEELVQIEELLLSRGIDGWRDVEAFAALNSPRAKARLKKALSSTNREISTAVLHYAPDLVSVEDRTKTLVAALSSARTYEGLTPTLKEIESFHPPEVFDALWKAVESRDGGTAVHLAAMLTFLYGKAPCAFDWDQRPFFLKFNTENPTERRALVQELRIRLEVRT